MKNTKNKISSGPRNGFTLMEILLTTALLAILVAASLGIIYWQMRVQSHVTQNAVFVNKLVNTQMMVRKVLRSIPPASLTVDVNKIQYLRTGSPTVDLFTIAGSSLFYNNQIILDGINASFSRLLANGYPDPSVATLTASCTNLIKIELTTMGRERRNIRFLVRPRGYQQ